jgi:magnesium transporter
VPSVNPVPKVHVYEDHIFLVLHSPEPGSGGHVHHIELDQFVGPNWVLTVHGRMGSEVTLDAAYVETASISRKLNSGRLRPNRPHELSDGASYGADRTDAEVSRRIVP